MSDLLKITRAGRVADVALNRPDVRNAFNGHLITAIIDAFTALGADDSVHVIVLRGEGPAFCAGADLGWMKQTATWTTAENEADARRLAMLFETIDTCPKPVVGQIHGAVRGGGLGLVSVCDIAYASADATFAFTEVRLGLAPAVISPYCVRRIGTSRARELFLTGATFDAARARDIGLLTDVVDGPGALSERVSATVTQLLAGGPLALAACKQLARTVSRLPDVDALATTTALIARLRASPEALEGMRAFLTKDKPSWMK
jgi:methylglutaconyl-CoA hydratase